MASSFPCSRTEALKACTVVLSERSAALLSPFIFAADVGDALQVNVVLPESDYLRKAETRLNREEQQNAQSAPPGAAQRGRNHRLEDQ